MDYEKMYNEALERAKRILCNLPEGAASISDIESIFPELRESEDERIRKELVALFIEVRNSEGNEGYWHDLKVADILAWLEKQKEQKPAGWSEEDEKMRLRAVEYISGLQDDYLEDWEELHPGVAYGPITSYDEVLDWLKSLRPSWKPSEEQMSMLLAVINDPNNAGAESCYMALNSIYNNLKKLM